MDKVRKVKAEEVLHELVKDAESTGNIGSVDADDVQASGIIIRQKMRGKGVSGMTPKEVLEVQRALFSDTGADPTQATREMKARLDREKWKRKRR